MIKLLKLDCPSEFIVKTLLSYFKLEHRYGNNSQLRNVWGPFFQMSSRFDPNIVERGGVLMTARTNLPF